MKRQTKKKEGFVHFQGGESHMKGLKNPIWSLDFTNKSL